ncbi:LysE family translocator [Mangrovicoccus algicola]|uniref:LysE family transporter n=1 Tax=Mangrovicoccus algicola TaxID=2771008 RepID=A0A8J7CJ48_9RHOB|nr:LysE family transporter [Mangrovicoccus algicola]MBE3640380.1 LysE family transporter [Mangrovicoccus algicola]
MISAAVLLPVFLTHLAAAISPGPAVLMTVRLAASQGMRTAAAYAAGVMIGAVIWAAAALLGLSVLFQILPGLFVAMKLIGAAFLVYVGFMTWRHASAPLAMQGTAAAMSVPRALRFGLVLQLTNPKPAVFFGAVFVTLVPPETPLAGLALVLAIVALNELASNLLVARIFSLPRARSVYMRLKTRVERVFGTLLAGFGVKLALS